MSNHSFLYIMPSPDGYGIQIRPSTDEHYPEGTQFGLDESIGLPLDKMSTKDLLKVKAQIATTLENRMDLDEVVEENLAQLTEVIKTASSEDIAKVLRQTLDRLDIVAADEKRAKTRKQILEDELSARMKKEGVSEMKFAGLVHVKYEPETVYSVGEEGWGLVYAGILAEALDAQMAKKENVEAVISEADLEGWASSMNETILDIMEDHLEKMKYSIKKEGIISGEDVSDVIGIIDDFQVDAKTLWEKADFSKFPKALVSNVVEALKENMLGQFDGVDAFSILQKRLTSTTLKELVSQGEDLPDGIESQVIRKIKTKRTK